MDIRNLLKFLNQTSKLLSTNKLGVEEQKQYLANYLQICQELSIEQRGYFLDILKKMDTLGKLPETLGKIDNEVLENKPSGAQEEPSNGILSLTKLARLLEGRGSTDEFAKKLEIMCKDFNGSLEYLTAYSEKNPLSPTIFYGACSFSVPEIGTKWTKDIWQQRARKDNWINLVENTDFKRALSAADIIEAQLKKDVEQIQQQLHEAKINFSKTSVPWDFTKFIPPLNEREQTYASDLWKKYYSSGNQHDFLLKCPIPVLEDAYARVANQYKRIPRGVHYVRVMQQLTKAGILEHQAIPYFFLAPCDSDAIPNVFIRGSDILTNSSYYLKKLDSSDPRAAYLGNLTDCCQSIDHDIGRQFTIHGITKPDSGFYVICKQTGTNPSPNDEIVSQAWAWRQNEALVLDSIEAKKENLAGKIKKTPYTNRDLWDAMYQKLATTVVGQQGISIVMVGWGDYGHTSRDIGMEATNTYTNPVSKYIVHDDDDNEIAHNDSASKMILAMDKIPLSELHKLRYGGGYFIGTESEKEQAYKKIRDFIQSENAFVHLCELKKYCISSEMVTVVNNFQSFYQSQMKSDVFLAEAKSTADNNFWLTMMNQPMPLQDINWTEWLLEYLSTGKPISNDVVKAFMDEEIDITAKNKLDETISMLAIQNGNTVLFEHFLKTKLLDNENLYLMEAIKLGKIEIVQCWSNKSIDFLYTDNNGDTALSLAIQNGRFDIAGWFMTHRHLDIRENLFQASTHNKIETMQWLVNQPGINLNEVSTHKNKRNSATFLIKAVTENNLNLVKFLVRQPEINLNLTNYDQHTALDLAIIEDHLDIVKCLTDQTNIEMDTQTLIQAIQWQRWEIVAYLATHPRVDLNVKQTYGSKNALELAQKDPDVPHDILVLLTPKPHEVTQTLKAQSSNTNDIDENNSSTELQALPFPTHSVAKLAAKEWGKRAKLTIKQTDQKTPKALSSPLPKKDIKP